jgi:mannose-6-phosphate isomerase
MDRLDNPIRPYAWGSADDLPEFLGVPGHGGPQAELWMGAHPDDSSRLTRDGVTRTLAEVIAQDPQAELGPAVIARFGDRLPFLFKVLSADKPLSLQVHPDKAKAEAAFAAQQQSGETDYTDDNHKPELICALRAGFQGLCGFRPVTQTIELLDELGIPELKVYAGLLAAEPAQEALRKLVTSVLTKQDDHAAVIEALRGAGERLAAAGGRWAAAGAAYARLAGFYPGDPGVLVALLLNHAVLAEGDALFVAAGVPHCYLEGFGAEVMASSDNVLRAGLTSKRVNVPELLAILDFRPAPLQVLRPVTTGGAEVYPVPVPDFRLARLELGGQAAAVPGGQPQILLCVAGTAVLTGPDGQQLTLSRGQSAFLGAAETGVTVTGPATVLRASTGVETA